MINFFKKSICLIIILILCPIVVCANKDNQLIEYHKITKEELNGEIQIPNKEGGWDTYSNIDTYEDLYSVLEDLSSSYKYLLEDYYELEGSLDEKNIEIDKLEDEISSLENTIEDLEEQLNSEQIKISNIKNSNDWKLIFIPIFIFGIPLLIDFLSNKIKKSNK